MNANLTRHFLRVFERKENGNRFNQIEIPFFYSNNFEVSFIYYTTLKRTNYCSLKTVWK